ncbi:pentatricopeptide repeat-containing protein 1, mitochondrial isoform X2 [Battus philenor]|uniref:pentatricopeptide repeat-containing protein 1, mitochondrial isoform X2 n=1 Tax=Battus philenor TaxID=42288 RepID=UPI0035D02406
MAQNVEDEGDVKEQQYLENCPLPSQKLTIKQYADLIKEYLRHKRLKEAINILEVRMLQEDRVKPENYIYNILIGACAEVGYTKKAFKLYNDMKRRALKPTGDTYTCLFEACINSPWPADGLKYAKHLRELMIEKGIEPNLTNYNVMIKAFGRCGDLQMAFKIVDEMISKKIKIRVHTFNHLLHACVADKENGFWHALVVWRKMLNMREKPNIYTFNLMLKCAKDCNLGSQENISNLIEYMTGPASLSLDKVKRLEISQSQISELKDKLNNDKLTLMLDNSSTCNREKQIKDINQNCLYFNEPSKEIAVVENQRIKSIQNGQNSVPSETRTVPNLLSKYLQFNQVFSVQEVSTLQDKFAIIGGQDDFLKEMEVMSVQPDIKTFTQMLPLIEDNREVEHKIMETMKASKVKPDINFFNMLIKKRCLRKDYEGAFLIKELIDDNLKTCKKSWQLKKAVKANILTYGILAMACKLKVNAEKLLNEMRDKQLKVNIEVLGTLLRQGTAQMEFDYILYIMDVVKQEEVTPNEIFLKHLEVFHDKCVKIIKQKQSCRESFTLDCKHFLNKYKTWLRDVQIKEVVVEHPWKQFMVTQPETVQRDNFKIKEPKKFYKRSRKYVQYFPKL